jgi:hypothetical protein
MRRFVRQFSAIIGLAPLLLAGIGNAAPQYFDWPIHVKQHSPVNLWSNLGEKRGDLGDGPNWLDHGATDFKPTSDNLVYSPDVGKVRFGESSDKKSGMPPVKIGHFSLLHFQDVNHLYVNPADLGDANRWTVIVRLDDPIQQTSTGPITSLRKLKKTKVAGVLKNGANWEDVFFYSITEPIGLSNGPDLHVIYYETENSAYSDVGDIRNMLSVIDYQNADMPEIQVVRFFSQKATTGLARTFILEAPGQGVMSIPDDGGIDIVVTTSSFATGNARAGIYELSWALHRMLAEREEVDGAIPGPNKKQMVSVVPETIMYTYRQMPDKIKDANLVARHPRFVLPGGGDISLFAAVDREKYTAYVVTNTDGDDGKHWELEDTSKFPDARYLLTITARNIKKSNGVGVKPALDKRVIQYFVDVVSPKGKQERRITVRKI